MCGAGTGPGPRLLLPDGGAQGPGGYPEAPPSQGPPSHHLSAIHSSCLVSEPLHRPLGLYRSVSVREQKVSEGF